MDSPPPDSSWSLRRNDHSWTLRFLDALQVPDEGLCADPVEDYLRLLLSSKIRAVG